MAQPMNDLVTFKFIITDSHFYRQSEDLLNYKSFVSAEQLVPAQQLQWNISPESAKDIESAKARLDR